MGWIALGAHYGLGSRALGDALTRVVAVPLLARWYGEDAEQAWHIVDGYRVGDPDAQDAAAGWAALAARWPEFQVERVQPALMPPPFVYESRDAPYLAELRTRYRLPELIADAPDEYAAMLALGAWVGTRWDHGVDPVPLGREACQPAAVVAAGEQGAKFWCEIAAKLAVHAALALGWQARLVTISRDGYTWEHAVAELWSNQFRKWFVLDTDFNRVYEADGVPLSAFQLCHEGEALRAGGRLRERVIAPAKPSLPPADLLPFYRYVHVDLRNDWCSRRLRRGSPVGGDWATWWTARPEMAVLTAKTRIDDPARFDWPVHAVTVHARTLTKTPEGWNLAIALTGYSPDFARFELSLDAGPWRPVADHRALLALTAGAHVLAARVMTRAGWAGPAHEVRFRLLDDR